MFKCKEDFDERVHKFDAAKGPALAVLFGPRPRAAPSRRGSSGGGEQGGRGPHTGNVCGVDVRVMIMLCAAWPE